MASSPVSQDKASADTCTSSEVMSVQASQRATSKASTSSQVMDGCGLKTPLRMRTSPEMLSSVVQLHAYDSEQSKDEAQYNIKFILR